MTIAKDVENNSSYIRILDHGFVGLIDKMPSDGDGDRAIVEAARVSYGKGTRKVSEDRALIRYLLRNKHTSPFEMVEFKFHLKIPIFVARQLIRHRTANVNEYSGRYSIMTDEFYVPDITCLGKQSKNNKQGRSENFDENTAKRIRNTIEDFNNKAYEIYRNLLEEDLARELSRIVLPVSNYTEMYWKIDLNNLLKFLSLRIDEHAQFEIRVLANSILELVRPYVPMTIEAWENYILNSVDLTHDVLDMIFKYVQNKSFVLREIENSDKLSRTEKIEIKNKLKKWLF